MAAGRGCSGALQIPLFKEEIKEGEEVRQVGKEKWLAKPPNVCNHHKGEDGKESYSHTPKAAPNNEPLCRRALCVNHDGAKRREGRPRTPQCDKSTHAVVGRAGWS